MDTDRKNVSEVRERQTDRQTELESEGVFGRGIVPLGKKEIMNYRLEWTQTERMYRK